jgi:PEP-CTERM motif
MTLPSSCRLCLLVCLISAVFLPASAQVLYNNGPVDGETDSFVINFGFTVSDTFTLSQSSQVTGLSFNAWIFPGDVIDSVDVSITSQENGGTTYFNQQVNTTQGACFSNEFGFNVCQETASFNAGNLAGGTYWLNLQNAMVNTGDPAFWDENSGVGCTSPGCPSTASENEIGTIPSESFTVLGTTSGTSSVPEPGSLLLLGSGIFASFGLLRRGS